MIFDNYEISLWTHNDDFIAILGTNGSYYQSEIYKPIYTYKTDGEETLTFSMPIKYIVRQPDLLGSFDLSVLTSELTQPETFGPATNCYLSNGSLISVAPYIIINDDGYAVIDNSKWYSVLTNNTLLANEKKIKLIFDKGTVQQRVKEFIITNLTQGRNGDEIFCNIECTSLAFYELGKIGYNLTFNEDTILLEEKEEEITIEPNLNYWMDKVFPSGSDWTYAIDMDYSEVFNGASANVVYEEPGVISWTAVENEDYFEPVYRTELVEKLRFPKIEKSNKYNVCQDLAELYGVYIKVLYNYLPFFDITIDYVVDDTIYYNGYEYKCILNTTTHQKPTNTTYWTKIQSWNPYKVYEKKIVFYNKPYNETEYSITYGDNETAIKKISDSSNIVTKLYVEDIESEYTNTGLISISDSDANKSMENFILNFEYYEMAGMLNENQLDAIHGDRDRRIVSFEEQQRSLNLTLQENFNNKYSYQNDLQDIESQIAIAEDRAEAANEVANDYADKQDAFDGALTTQVLTDSRILYMVLGSSSQYINFRRNGILSNNFHVYKMDNTEQELTTHYTKVLNSYGNVIKINILPASGLTNGEFVSCTYNYDLLVYYRNEQNTYMDIYNTNTQLISDFLEVEKASLETLIDSCDSNIATIQDSKKIVIDNFNNTMGFFLKEGSWNSEDHSGPYEQFDWSTVIFNDIPINNGGCELYYDTLPRKGEATISYQVGSTVTYHRYIEMENIKDGITTNISYNNIENLEIIEKNTSTGIIAKKYLYGAQFKPQYVSTSGGAARMVLVLDKHITIGSGNALYYNGIQLTVSTFTSSSAIVYRRLIIPDKKLLTTSIELFVGTKEQSEFNDYSIFTDISGYTYITLKINNNIIGTLSSIHVKYKSDRSVEQLFYDAQEVSRRSAYPEAKYEVSFIYLQKILNTHQVSATSNYLNISENLNDNIELQLASIVRINDYDLDLRGVKGVVSEITLDLEEPQNNSFIIQNYKTKFEDIFSRIVASTEQLSARSMAYERAATAIGPINGIVGNILQTAINNNSITLSSGRLSNIYWDETGIIVENRTPYVNGVTGQVFITGGGIFLSDRLDNEGQNRLYTAGITPSGINANLLTTGRLDTEKINIYSGEQLRFTWKADGIFAYKSKANGYSDFDNYVKYNEDGFFFSKLVGGTRVDRVEISWLGLILRNNTNQIVFYADPDTGDLTISGTIQANAGSIGGWTIDTNRLYAGNTINRVELNSDANSIYAISAGNETPANAPFYVTKTGVLYASYGEIANDFTVSGALGTPNFASGALGNGWRIDGSLGYAEFNDVYVRGTISASVFEYEEISSVGGQLYVAPTLIFLVPSNAVTKPSTKYVFTFPQDFDPAVFGGRTWIINDIISLNGFITINTVNYELRDVKCSITAMSGASIILTSILDASELSCYNNIGEIINYTTISWVNGIVNRNAKGVYLGTNSGGQLLKKGILLSTVGQYTPFIDVYDDAIVAGNPKVRLGNLAGITDADFGVSPLTGYGLYAENAYLTGSIVAESGYIGGSTNGWVIKEGALYNGGRSSILQNITGMYLGTDGFGLGRSLLYKTDTNELIISGNSITMGSGLIEPVPLADYIDNQLGYRLEVLSTSNILSSDITEITIYTRVYKGSTDVTANLPDSVFRWTRVSNDAFADGIWNSNPINQGRKTFTLSTLDVYYSATFTCSIVE